MRTMPKTMSRPWTLRIASLFIGASLAVSPVYAQESAEEATPAPTLPPLLESIEDTGEAAEDLDFDSRDESLPETTPNPAEVKPTPPNARPATPLAIPTLTPDQVSDEQVDQLVAALVKIEPLLRQASEDLRNAPNESAQAAIEQEFEAEATTIVTENGLTVDQYRQLITLANSNPNFGQRVYQELQQLQDQPDTDTQDTDRSIEAPADEDALETPESSDNDRLNEDDTFE